LENSSKINQVNPVKLKLKADDSRLYRKPRLFIESKWQQKNSRSYCKKHDDLISKGTVEQVYHSFGET